MTKRITYEEANQKFINQGRTDITLLKEGYINWGTKAKFTDNTNNEIYEAIPYNVFNKQSKPRKRAFIHITISFKDAQQKFINQGRTDIELIEEEYNGFYKRSLFLDKTINETFYSTPNYVYKNNLSHPKLRSKKTDVSLNEIQEYFKDRDDIILLKEHYKGFHKKALFLDKRVNEVFSATPYNVWMRKSKHKKSYIKDQTLSFEEAQKRLSHRTDIELIKNGYNGWKSKSLFYDKEIGEEFKAVPRNVLNRNSCHPKRKKISNAQIELYEDIKSLFSNHNNILLEQKLFSNKKKGYTADILFQDYNIIIEYNGDYWHANPKFYKKDYYNTKSKKYAEEIWKRDQKRNSFLEDMGYKVFIVWEYDYKHNKEEIINNLKKEIENIIQK